MTRTRLAVFLAWFTWTRPALAEPTPSLTPPAVQSNTEVPYPSGGSGDASVVLELLVDKDGRVAKASVIEGDEPFAEHARRAVSAWRFVPAQRGETVVAARIRARIDFRDSSKQAAPAPRPPTRSTTPPIESSAATKNETTPSTELPTEVVVRGERREIGETTLSVAEVREIPGAFGDPFRAVEALPGVTPMFSGLSYFFIRGAPPNNHGYYLDGIRVPLLFHVGLGPGVIHPALLDHMDFYPGAAPARFGGVAGGIIAGETRAPAHEAHGEASLRLVDAGALAEAPFADDRATALVGGRYGYPGPILSALSDVRLDYWDYQARVTWRATDDDTLSLLAFGSHDLLEHVEAPDIMVTGSDGSGDVLVEDFVSDFHRIDLRHDRRWVDGRLRTGVTAGYDSQGANPTYLTNKSAALRLDIEQELAPAVRVRAGGDARIDAYGLRREAPADPLEAIVPSNVDPPPTNLTAGAYTDFVWRIVPRIEIVPGVRFGVYDSTRAATPGNTARVRTTVPAVDPRLSARVGLSSRLAWLSTFGISHQYPALRVGSVPAIVTGAGFPPGHSELQETIQGSQGIEIALPAAVTLTATGFLSHSRGLTDLTADCLQIEPPTAPGGEGPPELGPYHCPSNAPVAGHTYGFELLIRRSLTERLSGWVAYTLSRSVREARFLRLDGSEAIDTVPSQFDRTHVLNAMLAYDLGRRWRAGTRFVFYSGVPYSALAGNVPVPPYHSERDPPFVRLDVRAEKRWPLGDRGSVALVLEGQNVTLSKEPNTLGMDCVGEIAGDTTVTECQRGEIGPITIPSVGVEAVF